MPAIGYSYEPKKEGDTKDAGAGGPAEDIKAEAPKSQKEGAAGSGDATLVDAVVAQLKALPPFTQMLIGGFLLFWLLFNVYVAVGFVLAAKFGPGLVAAKFQASVEDAEAAKKSGANKSGQSSASAAAVPQAVADAPAAEAPAAAAAAAAPADAAGGEGDKPKAE